MIQGGEEGLNRGFQFLMHDLGRERLIIAIAASAAMDSGYEWTRDYIKERHGMYTIECIVVISHLAFGKPLASMQQVRHTMAEIKTDIMLSRVITDKLIEAYANDDLDQQSVSMAKVSYHVL